MSASLIRAVAAEHNVWEVDRPWPAFTYPLRPLKTAHANCNDWPKARRDGTGYFNTDKRL